MGLIGNNPSNFEDSNILDAPPLDANLSRNGNTMAGSKDPDALQHKHEVASFSRNIKLLFNACWGDKKALKILSSKLEVEKRADDMWREFSS